MKRVISFILFFNLLSCGDLETPKTENIKIKAEIKEMQQSNEFDNSSRYLENDIKISKIIFDKNKVSKYIIEEAKIDLAKTLIKPLSSYTTKELLELSQSKRLRCHVIVPSDISKESLSNTLKSILFKKN